MRIQPWEWQDGQFSDDLEGDDADFHRGKEGGEDQKVVQERGEVFGEDGVKIQGLQEVERRQQGGDARGRVQRAQDDGNDRWELGLQDREGHSGQDGGERGENPGLSKGREGGLIEPRFEVWEALAEHALAINRGDGHVVDGVQDGIAGRKDSLEERGVVRRVVLLGSDDVADLLQALLPRGVESAHEISARDPAEEIGDGTDLGFRKSRLQ